MRKSVMNVRIFCVAVGLMTASTWANPIFKLWVTEVYEVNPDGTYTAKCGGAPFCPTQDLQPGIAQPGDLINIEVTVEGWDASTDSGVCDSGGDICSVSNQDCTDSHCSGVNSHGLCSVDASCQLPDTCDPDSCEKSPLVGAFQFVMDCSTYSNGGPPGLAPARLPCTRNGTCLGGDNDGEPCEPANGNADCFVGGICERSFECACAYTRIPGGFNDCADFVDVNEAFCTCSGPQAACDEGVCGGGAVAYIDSSAVPNYLFFGNNFLATIGLSTCDYEIGAFLLDANPGGVPEELFRCNAGARPICNVDADCPSGTCELVATPEYYLGTVLLEVTGDSCDLFTIDLIQELSTGVPIATFLNDNDANKLPAPIVETLTIDLGVAVICNDGDPCTENDGYCGNNPDDCAGTPIECPEGQVCFLGECIDEPTDCDFVASLTDATWADDAPLATEAFDRPGNCAIDAREPHLIADVNAKAGWDRLVLQYDCDPTDIASTLRPPHFAVETDPVEVSPPIIPPGGIESSAAGQTITIHLNRSISPGFYTCITHIDTGSHWCAGYLPADAGQDGLSSATDVNTLINAINLVPGGELPIYATDINRSDVTTGADILRLIDLLNGAGDFAPWIAQGLPDCPPAP